jgi:SAM-dependent methyltransferase
VNRLSSEELTAEIIRLGPWHHDVEVAPGLRTGEITRSAAYASALGVPSVIHPESLFTRLAGELFPNGLAGRSILDCACNAGGYLFAAKRLGAGRCFGFDVRDHWIRQARFLAGHLPSSDLEFDTRDLDTLPALRLEPFDITLFMGIFYHLPDPIAGLRIAADLTKELLVVNTAFRPSKKDALILNQESMTEVMSGVHGLAWWPSGEGVMRQLLAWCGFPHTRLQFTRRVTSNHHRMEILAARNENTFAHYDTIHRPARYKRWLRKLRAYVRR